MSDIEVAVQGSRRIEGLLEQKLGATGKGLHSKLSSVENMVSSAMVSRIRYIASTRNNVVHEDGATIENIKDFQKTVEQVSNYLETTHFKRKTALPKLKAWQKTFVRIVIFLIIIKIIARFIAHL